MCTVVFIPYQKSVFLGSIRDENPNRTIALSPKVYKNNNTAESLYPKDPLGGGTWVGVNKYSNIIILLNGGFVNHKRQASYAKSRGLIVKELLQSILPVVDWVLLDLTNVEPFTLIVWTDNNLFQLVWDGAEKKKILLDKTIAHIWSSATLYDIEAKLHRENLFQQWINTKPIINKETVLNFFKTYQEKSNGFIMHRNEFLQTLSFSFISMEKEIVFDYIDFVQHTEHIATLSLKSEQHTCLISI